jgi:archaellum component FlaC
MTPNQILDQIHNTDGDIIRLVSNNIVNVLGMNNDTINMFSEIIAYAYNADNDEDCKEGAKETIDRLKSLLKQRKDFYEDFSNSLKVLAQEARQKINANSL